MTYDDMTEEEREIYRTKVSLKVHEVQLKLRTMINKYCGPGNPFYIRAGAAKCEIRMRVNGKITHMITLMYEDENTWSDYEFFCDILDVIIERALKLEKKKFIALKDQLKPFLTPRQEVGLE